jgi:hypothetical protein
MYVLPYKLKYFSPFLLGLHARLNPRKNCLCNWKNKTKKKMEKSEKNIACYELQQSQTDDVRLKHFSNEKNPDFSGFGETF